jgi:hypothetical protein
MYQNPVLNAPLGPDGVPVQVAPEEVMEHYEVRLLLLLLLIATLSGFATPAAPAQLPCSPGGSRHA